MKKKSSRIVMVKNKEYDEVDDDNDGVDGNYDGDCNDGYGNSDDVDATAADDDNYNNNNNDYNNNDNNNTCYNNNYLYPLNEKRHGWNRKFHTSI